MAAINNTEHYHQPPHLLHSTIMYTIRYSMVVAALLQQLLAAVVFAGSKIIYISPSLLSGEIRHKSGALMSALSLLPLPILM